MIAYLLAAAVSVPAIPADSAFKSWTTDAGVTIEKAETKAYPYVRGTHEVAAGCDAIKDVLFSFDRYESFFKDVVRSVKVESSDATHARIYYVWAYPWPFRDRDSMVAYTLAAQEAGGWTISWQNDRKDGDPKTGVRLDDVTGQTRLTPVATDAKRCTVQYTFYGNVGIDVGKSIREGILKKEPPKYFEAIAKGLAGSAK